MGDYAEQQFAEDQHDLALAMWTVAMDTAKEHAAPFSPAIAKKVAEHILLPRAAAHLHHQQYSRARDDYRAVVVSVSKRNGYVCVCIINHRNPDSVGRGLGDKH